MILTLTQTRIGGHTMRSVSPSLHAPGRTHPYASDDMGSWVAVRCESAAEPSTPGDERLMDRSGGSWAQERDPCRLSANYNSLCDSSMSKSGWTHPLPGHDPDSFEEPRAGNSTSWLYNGFRVANILAPHISDQSQQRRLWSPRRSKSALFPGQVIDALRLNR